MTSRHGGDTERVRDLSSLGICNWCIALGECFYPGQNRCGNGPCASDCISLSKNEATHPRCSVEGCPGGPGRASYMEGESWGMHKVGRGQHRRFGLGRPWL